MGAFWMGAASMGPELEVESAAAAASGEAGSAASLVKQLPMTEEEEVIGYKGRGGGRMIEEGRRRTEWILVVGGRVWGLEGKRERE